MTDNEIIEALECCVKHNGNCEPCEIWEFCREHSDQMPIETLDLINRQKAEIERLNKELVENKADNRYIQRLEALFKCASMELKTAKAEAIKEFAERLKENEQEVCSGHGIHERVVSVWRIDNLVKEMVGDEK